ncbi:MAG: bifunctional enoyl-CoA hydratase/phosphate acetyltransferase [Terrisporobacter othiniensis]|uniref:Phosphate acetyltransferase n=1 Tax=Terrisporobacter petrolearius TaxID=1460447 RepID=A0ABZ3FH24_9FIRM|nr:MULTISPECIES: bifunctional enoyl-CoA hydratase/phosphate acetyltransferase [Terrisporobacter]MBN9648540.1 bifunctional enoyl-CoA hydratase/phosphate acetyltransferase [Terrisporobacter glycolicus]MDU4861452.1 bifunctional enoyl-CoA hydratase/phosphate acetyltransferase [Terrisporobacter othiniensis]MDU6994599.1 bifunctional enoyl-CoA hydratase/phosphate acetyltransferase [Terrisporobacter othiniensis]HBI92082.1 phosphate butyryltransferase [Terrisporobacter hibernicus]
MINKLEDILDQLKGDKKVVLSVAAAHDEEVLLAIQSAVEKDIIVPILIGEENKIREISKEIKFDLNGIKIIQKDTIEECAEAAVKLVSSKEADFVMKGLLDTSVILKAVLNKEWGLRTDSLLSHVMVYEIPAYDKLLVTTDGGMNIAPDYDQKVKILKNAIEATKPLGLEEIKVACLAAKEKVNPKMPATVDAKALQEAGERGEFGEGVIVEGPLAFDLAVSKEAAKIKGFESRVAGKTDIMLMPTIEVGNGIGKTLTYFAGGKSAGIIMGAKAPIVLVSRADSHESKLYSIAYGALIAGHNK